MTTIIGQLKPVYTNTRAYPAPQGYAWRDVITGYVIHPEVAEESHMVDTGQSLHLQIDRRNPFQVDLGNFIESLNPIKGPLFGPFFGHGPLGGRGPWGGKGPWF